MGLFWHFIDLACLAVNTIKSYRDKLTFQEIIIACMCMDAVSASISMSFADKEVLASRWLVRWSGFIQLFAFIVEGLALGTLPSSKITDDHDRKCNVVLPWVGSLSSQYGAPPELWLYLAFRLALWLAQFLLGITLMGKFNDLETIGCTIDSFSFGFHSSSWTDFTDCYIF